MTFEQIMKGFLMFCVGLAISLTLFLLAVAVGMMQQKKLDAHLYRDGYRACLLNEKNGTPHEYSLQVEYVAVEAENKNNKE